MSVSFSSLSTCRISASFIPVRLAMMSASSSTFTLCHDVVREQLVLLDLDRLAMGRVCPFVLGLRVSAGVRDMSLTRLADYQDKMAKSLYAVTPFRNSNLPA